MTAAPEYSVGDKVEVGVKVADDGVLVDPASATAYVTSPSGTTENSVDHPTKVGLVIGSTDLSSDIGDDLGLSAAELAAGTGIVRVLFIATESGPWGIHVHGEGSAQGSADATVYVRENAAGVAYTGTATI